MMITKHLLDQAVLLARRGKRPRDTDLKRAVSTVYYALFHAIAEEGADTLIGVRQRKTTARVRAYRSLDHSKAKREFKKMIQVERKGVVLQLASLFLELQELRHYADYDPRPSELSRIGVFALIKRTGAVVEAFISITPEIWRDIATALLLRDRQ